jgi:putative ABC transport system permease protein
MIFTIALRNLIRQGERFSVLFATLALGGWLFVLLMGTMNSFSESLKNRAVRYFAGNVILTGYNDKTVDRWIDDEAALRKAVADSGVPVKAWARRSINYDQDTTLFFGGASQKQRRLIGVDWSLEIPTFRTMDYLSGGPDEMAKGDGILLSDSAAARLKIRVGDDIQVQINTKTGQVNILNLKVRGIFRDASFFGYSSYIDIRAMDRALGVPETAVAELGLVLPPGTDEVAAAHRIWRTLETRLPVVGFAKTQAELDKARSRDITDSTRKYAVLPLQVRLGQIQTVLDALNLVAWSLNGLFLFIILVGVNNTYRMIVFERIREIGTMRALGMGKARLSCVFLAEAGLLGLTGAATGWALGNAVLWVVSLWDFGDNVLMAMFLERGHLVWTVPWAGLVGVTLSLILASLAGAGGPALGAASWRPVDALRHEA